MHNNGGRGKLKDQEPMLNQANAVYRILRGGKTNEEYEVIYIGATQQFVMSKSGIGKLNYYLLFCSYNNYCHQL